MLLYMQKSIFLKSKNNKVKYKILFDENEISLEIIRHLKNKNEAFFLAFYSESLQDVINKNYSQKESERYYVALLNYIEEKLPEILI